MAEEYNLYPLHVFRIVARLGSVTRAAQELYISQPAVSTHIRSVEAHYKEALFEPAMDKTFRQATYFQLPDEVKNL